MHTNKAEQARAIATALQMQVDEMTDELASLRTKLDVAREALGVLDAYLYATAQDSNEAQIVRTALATIDGAQK